MWIYIVNVLVNIYECVCECACELEWKYMVYALFVGGLERNRAVWGGNLTPIGLTIADGVQNNSRRLWSSRRELLVNSRRLQRPMGVTAGRQGWRGNSNCRRLRTGRRELTPGARADVAKINCCWPDCGRWGPTTVI